MDLFSNKELMKQIADWHTKTFDSTRDEQMLKLKEEITEAEETTNIEDWYKEFADILFVLSALIYRYQDDNAVYFAYTIAKVLPEFMSEQIMSELNKKFEINKNRKWEKQPDGTYHHI